jgi:hypothetical protein
MDLRGATKLFADVIGHASRQACVSIEPAAGAQLGMGTGLRDNSLQKYLPGRQDPRCF